MAFCLPREYIASLANVGDTGVLLDSSGLDTETERLQDVCEAETQDRLVPLGMWGDGVPVNWDRSESVEVFSLNLPGQSGKYKLLRMPLGALSHKQVSGHTLDDIMSVLAWSFHACAMGVHPRERHDKGQWLSSDAQRCRAGGNSAGVRSSLVQVRGDWKFFAEIFRFPKWNTKAGCCRRCNCTPEKVTCLYVCIYVYKNCK